VCSGLLVDPRPMPWGMITVKFSTGGSGTVPVDKITASPLYKIHCDKIQNYTNIKIAVALTDQFSEKRVAPKWAEASVSMYAGSRKTYLSPILECFSSRQTECQFPLLPNDWRNTYLFMLLWSWSAEEDLDASCLIENCPLPGAFYISTGVVVVPRQPLGSHQ
jgi:hypothetical protein